MEQSKKNLKEFEELKEFFINFCKTKFNLSVEVIIK